MKFVILLGLVGGLCFRQDLLYAQTEMESAQASQLILSISNPAGQESQFASSLDESEDILKEDLFIEEVKEFDDAKRGILISSPVPLDVDSGDADDVETDIQGKTATDIPAGIDGMLSNENVGNESVVGSIDLRVTQPEDIKSIVLDESGSDDTDAENIVTTEPESVSEAQEFQTSVLILESENDVVMSQVERQTSVASQIVADTISVEEPSTDVLINKMNQELSVGSVLIGQDSEINRDASAFESEITTKNKSIKQEAFLIQDNNDE